jgi:hypothetical protein
MRGATCGRRRTKLIWLAGIGAAVVLCSPAGAASPPFKITSTLDVAEDTVVARVLRAPDPPAALAGTWQRTPDTTGHPTFPKGTYKLVFERRWIQERFPGRFDPVKTHANGPGTGQGLIEDNDWEPRATTFHVENAVVFKRFDRNDPEGGSPCFPGQGTDYSWSVDGNTLTLTPVGGKDPCAPRGFLWTGEWTRVR